MTRVLPKYMIFRRFLAIVLLVGAAVTAQAQQFAAAPPGLKTVTLNVPETVPAPVIPFPAPKASTRPEWARRMAWFAFGALAALLLLEAPIAAFVLIPLSIPLIAVESARKSWRPLAPRARASQSPVTGTDEDDDRKAA